MADLVVTADVDRDGSTFNDQREYAMVPLASIRIHPLNLRKELRGVEELTDSIRQNGLLEPVLLVPDPDAAEDSDDRFLLVAGHRRHAACVAARHDPVEAIIRHDLGDRGEQIIAMLTENGPRDDLTPIEEAHGYQLALELNHLTPTRLARRLGKPKDRIARRVSLTRLPEAVQERVHTHQVSLHEAEAMVEFVSDADAMRRLLDAVGSSNFGYQVEQARHRREAQQKIAALRRELQQAGVRVIDRPADYGWRSVEKPIEKLFDPGIELAPDQVPAPFTPETHAACAFHAAFTNAYDSRPEYVCTNPAEAGHQAIDDWQRAQTTIPNEADVDVAAVEAERLRQAEEEQQRQEEAVRAEAERREALEVAGKLRASFLATLVSRSGKAHLAAVLQLILTEHFEAWITEADTEELYAFAELVDAKVPQPADDERDQWDELVANLRAALSHRRTPDAVAGALLALVGRDRELALTHGHGWSNASCRRYLDFLVAQGYGLTEIEDKLAAEVAVGH